MSATENLSVIQKFYPKGSFIFVRCVTFYYTGEVVENDGHFIRLKNATWVAETGNFNKALIEELFSESEAYPNDVIVNIGSIVDGTILNTLPVPKKS